MNPEMLETLLLDRALGELTPEVAALLEAEIARTPGAARRAAEIDATLQLAGDAIAMPNLPPHRALDTAHLRAAESHARSSIRRMEILRLAACLTLGLGVGWMVRAPQSQTEIATSLPSPTLVPATAESAISPVRFWSLSRLTREQAAATPRARPRGSRLDLDWNSAAKLPRLEENL